MAQHESDREDLMREATALVRRIELAVPHERVPVVAGQKRNGHWSLYFGPDPVYQFDEQSRLRRAYADGLLYRAEGDTLARLRRQRTPEATELLRHDLTAGEQTEFLGRMHERLLRLYEVLSAGDARVVQQVPAEDKSLPSELKKLLQRILRLP